MLASALALSLLASTSSLAAQDGTEAGGTPRSEAPDAARDEEVVVTAFRRRYAIGDSDTALGMSASILDTPLSVAVVPSDLLADQQINNVEDALRNVAAVTRFKQGNGGEEKFSIRGFDASQNLFIDGARLNNQFNATNISSTETANIERYEILKGPSAILFGQGLPGGVINYVTKKPVFGGWGGSTEVIGGSFGYLRSEFDLNLPLGDTFGARGVASYQDSEGFRDFDFRRRLLLYPAASARLGPNTRLDAAFSYIRDRYTQDRGQILAARADGTFAYPDNLRRDMFLGIPGFNTRTRSNYRRLHLNLDHRWSGTWRTEIIAAGTEVDKDLFDGSANRVLPDGRVRIVAGVQGGTASTRYVRLNNELTFDTGAALRHRVLVSASLDVAQNDPFFADVRGSGVVLFDPAARTYEGLDGDFSVDPDSIDRSDRARTREIRVSAQDLLSIGERWVLLAGVGHSRFTDRITGETEESTDPRLGVIWKPAPATSLYASYATGYNPNFSAFDRNGAVLPGERLRQVEAGAKAEFGRNLLLTAAVFQIDQRGQAVTDPSTIDLPPAEQFSAALGRTRTRGGEAQLIGNITDRLRLIAGYAYLDAELVDDGLDLDDQGNRLPGIPEHSGSLFAVYELEGALEGLAVGGGLFAQSRVPIGFENRSFYGGWAQLDATVNYKLGRWKLQANVRNLLNADYRLTQALAFEALAARRVGVATPRTVLLSLERAF